MRKSIYYLTSLFIFFCLSVNATSIRGVVLSNTEEPVYYANVILFNALDSSIVDLQYSDEDGSFSFASIAIGDYWLECRYVGFPDIVTDIISVSSENELTLDILKFDSPANELDEITVRAKKPLLEMKPDKIVMNVEGSINASGSDAFTLLRKSPGVVIDNSDNIFMLGKGGVKIYIDGKPSPLNGTDLIEYLKSIPSSEIATIEIITHPSAKYESEGNAGIINIKFRRDKNLGTSGNVSISARQGETFGGNGTLRLTNRTKKLNTFGSISVYDGAGKNPFSIYREQNGLVFDHHSNSDDDYSGLNYRFGTDFYINPKHTIGFQVNGSSNSGKQVQKSETFISKQGNTVIDSILIARAESEFNRDNDSYNVNYKFDSGKGSSLNVDFDYGTYNRGRDQNQPNTYFEPITMDTISQRDFANESPSEIEIATAKVDYEIPLLNGVFGAGIKVSHVNTDNTFNFYNVVNKVRELDITKSNSFYYEEKVNAAYVSYSHTVGELGMNAGLRLEQTSSTGTLEAMVATSNEKVERDYFDFFPSLGLSYKLDDKNSFQFNYSRRLNRPSYNNLNPFRQRLDELTFEQGNPFLNPEYAASVQLSHSWNYKLNTSVSYSHTSDMIARITDAEGENYAFITYKNIADQYSYALNVSAPIPIKPWWNSYTSLTGMRTQNKADFGEGKKIDLTVYTFNLYSQHSFTLPKGYVMELSGWYSSPSIWEGNFKMDEMFSVDFGIQKSLLNDKLNLKVSVSDIFKSQKWHGVTNFGGQHIDAMGGNDSRRVKLNASYKFGNSNVKARRRKLGLEDEESRIGSDN